MVRICFVCLGNICRSPTAEGVFRHIVEREGLESQIEIDSAGTGGWHAGERADARARAAAEERGIELSSIARQVTPSDFGRFDYLLAMDSSNFEHLRSMAEDDEQRERVRLFRSFDPKAPRGAEVPDPYYGGTDGFTQVFDMCEAAARGLLSHLREKGRIH